MFGFYGICGEHCAFAWFSPPHTCFVERNELEVPWHCRQTSPTKVSYQESWLRRLAYARTYCIKLCVVLAHTILLPSIELCHTSTKQQCMCTRVPQVKRWLVIVRKLYDAWVRPKALVRAKIKRLKPWGSLAHTHLQGGMRFAWCLWTQFTTRWGTTCIHMDENMQKTMKSTMLSPNTCSWIITARLLPNFAASARLCKAS